jgi:enoyl-CoA hydratase/carnithine racemase/predicted CoA-binding protein
MNQTNHGEALSDQEVLKTLGSVTTIAMVGASADESKPSHQVFRYLTDAGYQAIPVNPRPDLTEILGHKVYPSLQSIDRPVDMVDVFRPSEELPEFARQAVEIGAGVFWGQIGVASDEAAQIAGNAGLQVVMDRCPKIELSRSILLRTQSSEGILRLTLNDQSRRNALSMDMLGLLRVALDRAASDPTVRVIVLAANGPAFCAGHDLKEMTRARQAADGGRSFFAETMTSCSGVMQAIVNNPKPVIAEVDGVATAAGCQLVASCDLAYASPAARLATPGVNIGLFCSTPMVALSRNVENKHAMEMLLTGDLIDAGQAAAIGLINRVVPAEELADYTTDIAGKVASKSSMTLETGKKAFYRQREMPLADAYEYTSNVMVDNMLRRDAEEGINAFIEKRAPHWSDQ